MGVKNVERGQVDARLSTLIAIEKVFLKKGVIFLEPGDTRSGGVGGRLKR
jgi:hypothetical protein